MNKISRYMIANLSLLTNMQIKAKEYDYSILIDKEILLTKQNNAQ